MPADCEKGFGRSPFVSSGKVCISEGHVYFARDTRLIDLWFAASAANQITLSNSQIEKQQILEQIRKVRLEEIEANRLCDVDNQGGYFSSKFCDSNAAAGNVAFPVSACPRP